MTFFKHFLTLNLLLTLTIPALHAVDANLINASKRGVVSIQVRAKEAAYSSTGTWSGSGFIVNRDKGIILTNKHVIGETATSTFEVTFFNGAERDAVLLYVDPILDYGFIKVDPKTIPNEVKALTFSKDKIDVNKPVFILGKNEGQNFSVNIGRVSSAYESIGEFPNQTYRISLNAQGGASGSPVIDEKGEVIALTHASNLSSAAFALPIGYVSKPLQDVENDKTPSRQFTGALVSYHSLDRTRKFANFPEDKINSFREKYPNALNKALHVSQIFKNSPAEGKLELGDVIWSINGEEIGPELLKFDTITNESDSLDLGIIRNGKSIKATLKPYNLYTNTITRMLKFGGAMFYECDHFIKKVTGADYKTVFVTKINTGSSFYDTFPPIRGTNSLFIQINKLGPTEIKSLDDVISATSDLMKQKDFYVNYTNRAFTIGFGGKPDFSNEPSITEVSFIELDGPPELYTFHKDSGNWKRTVLK